MVESGKLRQGLIPKRGGRDYPHRRKRLTFCQNQEFYQEKLLTFPPDSVYKWIVDNYIYEKLLTFMVPKQYLTGFTPSVIVSGDNYIVDYGIGECVYTYQKMGKRIKQEVLQLIKCDMWMVITIIDQETPLNEMDYKDLNMEIRTHSLSYVEEFISSQRG